MSIIRHSQLLKYAIITVVVIIFILAASRQTVSPTLDNEQGLYRNQREEFIKQVEEKILNVNRNNENINSDHENENENEKDSEDEQVENNNVVDGEDTQMPFDDRMPGAYLRFNEPAETNKSYCKFNYGFPYNLVYEANINMSSPEQGKASPYRIIYNIIEAYNTENVVQVTYASHVTANFAYYIPQLLRFWEGLIVIAAFVPDLDAAFFLGQINQYCYCEPEMYRVSIHIITHKTVPFSKKDIYFDRPESCLPEDSSRIVIYKDNDDAMIYPINVLRNVARTSALTKYVILSDIELMPSKGLASGFLKMLEKYNSTNPREVFVVPIFEVEDTEFIPENKMELLKLREEKKAVYFHEIICHHCQKFPGIETWLTNGFSDIVKPLITVKRQKPYNRWEPLFIGTNQEPLYSELLSWEGLQDKMTQSLEMCLLDYDYTILDNAFLCHWPGIKKQKVSSEEWRINYVLENKVVYKQIIQELQEKYVDIPDCVVNDTSALLTAQKKDHLFSKLINFT